MIAAGRPPDEAERETALDPSRSFIVQAPAGSGKTELLIQRFLRLLARAEEPEEVLAVTFTRKAAGEMRSRVIAALQSAEEGRAPEQAHLLRSFNLAADILRHERRRQWQLHRHPSRLNISTIDSVNAWLSGRAPVSSAGSALRRVTDTPEPLYREAAQATLAMLAEDDAAGDAVAALLRHLDNDASRFERLLVAMLPRRDQWLRQVLAADSDRGRMEDPLHELVAHSIALAADLIEPAFAAELLALLSYAGRQLEKAGRQSSLSLWAGVRRFPAADPASIGLWQALADALLTGDDAWRRTVNVQLGFPPGTDEKERMLSLLEGCASRPDSFRDRLAELRNLPGAGYTDQQWAVLQSLLDVLRLAAAQLELVFADHGTTDFPGVAATALRALGGEGAPSELGLALDYRIQHVLIDEFQDTSWSQFDLLRQLTSGWEPGDGRTLFAVGDPMQSIYRFREADVGIFMRVRDEGVGAIRPEFLRLRSNFRSLPAVIEWTNATFRQTFPEHDDALLGAVSFAPSEPGRLDDRGEGGVTLHWLAAGDDQAEERQVIATVRAERERDPAGSVCILVRSRSHAGRIIAGLRAARIEFVAPEIENLERASVAQDLLALTRALIHPADRLAWIGVLRAPWCGLPLRDLDALLGDDLQRSVAELLSDPARARRLSEEGVAGVGRLQAVLARVAPLRGRRTLRDLVEGTWLELAGPASVRDSGELETAEEFLRLLEACDAGGDCPDPVWLGEQMKSRRGSLGSGTPGVQVMTMHKAKGLEFGTVIIPGLAKVPRGDQQPLLAAQVVPTGNGRSATVLSPMASTGSDGDPLYRYLMRIEQQKKQAEAIRLLYVAATRARKRLHLFMQVTASADEDTGEIRLREPRSGSLLEQLWPAVAPEARQAAGGLRVRDDGRDESRVWVQPRIRRFRADFRLPHPPPAVRLADLEPREGASMTLEYEWAGNWSRHAGSVVHRWLRVIAEEGVARFDEARLRSLRTRFVRQLEDLGTPSADVAKAATRVVEALCRAIADEKGRWILSADHTAAGCEYPLVHCSGGRFRQIVIDRTFIDRDGNRWVIDYKTGTHEGGDLAAFLASESQRHEPQLRRYRDAMRDLGPEPVRTALYYPLLAAFREIS